MTQTDLARRYLEAQGLRPRILRVPTPVVYAGALAVNALFRSLGRPSPLSVYRVRSALARLTFDLSAAERRLGWTPRVGVEAGLVRTIARSR